MFREEVLENEKRRVIYFYVKSNPGLHLREIQRRLSIPLTSLDYHLGYLVHQNLLYRDGEGFYTRYFDEEFDQHDRLILSILRQRRLREILLILLSQTKMAYGDLLSSLNIPSSTLSLYLSKLVDAEIVERHSVGRETYYTVNGGGRVADLLVLYRSSFMDRLIDNALVTFLESGLTQEKD